MKKIPTILAAASALALAACQGGQRYTVQPSPTPNPAAPSAPTVPGTAGALTQVGIDKYMDGLEADLRARLKGQGVGVARRGNDILLTIPNDKLFEGARPTSSSSDLLAGLARVLSYYDHTRIEVNGYTDTSGGADANLAVSQKRATAVGEALEGDGIAASRIAARGFGATNLKIATGDNVSEPRNRRIEIHIVAKP